MIYPEHWNVVINSAQSMFNIAKRTPRSKVLYQPPMQFIQIPTIQQRARAVKDVNILGNIILRAYCPSLKANYIFAVDLLVTCYPIQDINLT
jgi:hypothetical protein